MDSIIDERKHNLKTSPPCKNKQDYIGGTYYKTRESDYSPSDTDGCARNLRNEHKNEEDKEYIEPPPGKNDRIKSKISEGITEEDVIIILSAKKIHAK